ncbi:MAG: TIGR02647 family protein [Gammaproteobacteria bacterium]|nr:TIGR02647 family protein [Gammaproteobacteria bacterium]
MRCTREQMDEVDILVRYNLQTTHQGIKVHSSASKEHVEAVKRLYEKGLVTQRDGGYLTDLGRKAAEHAQALILMLAPHHETVAS